MANVINTLLKNTILCPLKYATKQSTKILQTQVRTLYSPTTLGIDGYIQQRERTKTQLANISDKFRQKMNDYTTDDSKNMIFTEDLKNMVHLAEADDIELVIKMMKRFNDQGQQIRFGNFIFGPVVLRMFHHLKKSNEALECFNSPQLKGFFDQLISYQLLMDVLYENQQYQEILDVFEQIKTRQIEGTKYPRNIVVLTLAACYKINTPESLQIALKLWTELSEIGHMPMRRAATFCAGLALNQGNPEACIEICSSTRNQNYTTIRNLKVAALADVGRIDDAFPILKSVLSQESPMKHTFNIDVLEKVKAAVVKNGKPEMELEYTKLEQFFKDNGHISVVKLADQLCLEISPPPFLGNKAGLKNKKFTRYRNDDYNDNQNDSYGGNYNRNRPNFDNKKSDYQNRRPGLTDLQ